MALTSCGHQHSFSEEWSKDATTHWYQATCGHTTEVSDMVLHIWDEGEVTTEATDEAVAPTCTSTGLTEGKHCSVCNEVLVDQEEVAALGALCYIIGACLMFIITPNNVFLDLGIYILASVVCSFGMGVYSTISWAMMGDAIDYNEWKNGTREEGVVYSLHSFFRKLAQGVGPAVAILIMASMGYVNNAVVNTDPSIIDSQTGEMLTCLPVEHGMITDVINVAWLSDETIVKIRGLVAILYLVAGIFQFVGLGLVYNLDKKTLNKMNAELKIKHQAE